MYPNPQMFPWIFNLEGTFLGFVGRASAHTDYLVLEVDEESFSIRLPGLLKDRLQAELKPGDRIQCIGRSQLDFLSKALKLEAYQVLPLSAVSLPAPIPMVRQRSRRAS